MTQDTTLNILPVSHQQKTPPIKTKLIGQQVGVLFLKSFFVYVFFKVCLFINNNSVEPRTSEAHYQSQWGSTLSDYSLCAKMYPNKNKLGLFLSPRYFVKRLLCLHTLFFHSYSYQYPQIVRLDLIFMAAIPLSVPSVSTISCFTIIIIVHCSENQKIIIFAT